VNFDIQEACGFMQLMNIDKAAAVFIEISIGCSISGRLLKLEEGIQSLQAE